VGVKGGRLLKAASGKKQSRAPNKLASQMFRMMRAVPAVDNRVRAYCYWLTRQSRERTGSFPPPFHDPNLKLSDTTHYQQPNPCTLPTATARDGTKRLYNVALNSSASSTGHSALRHMTKCPACNAVVEGERLLRRPSFGTPHSTCVFGIQHLTNCSHCS
jgi:hypothetical protein